MQIINSKNLYFAILFSLSSKLAVQILLILEPKIWVDTCLAHWADYVSVKIMISNIDSNVGWIIVDGKNVCRFTGHQKVNTLDLVSFHGYILSFLQEIRLQQWTEPREEAGLLYGFQIDHLVELFFIYVEAGLDFKSMG